MPIYEFYCCDCHTIFNFLARIPNTTKRPACPRCGRPKLERKMSLFAVGKRRTESEAEDGLPPGLDEAKMEQAFSELARDAEVMNEDDPRQMARMMRRLSETAGLRFSGDMEEALRRMEAGEDPDKIEEEMGDVLEDEDALLGPSEGGLKGLSRRLKPPNIDETLYDL